METVTAAVEYLEGINLASITMRIVMSMTPRFLRSEHILA